MQTFTLSYKSNVYSCTNVVNILSACLCIISLSLPSSLSLSPFSLNSGFKMDHRLMQTTLSKLKTLISSSQSLWMQVNFEKNKKRYQFITHSSYEFSTHFLCYLFICDAYLVLIIYLILFCLSSDTLCSFQMKSVRLQNKISSGPQSTVSNSTVYSNS